jgi:hypothetical protein
MREPRPTSAYPQRCQIACSPAGQAAVPAATTDSRRAPRMGMARGWEKLSGMFRGVPSSPMGFGARAAQEASTVAWRFRLLGDVATNRKDCS